MKNKPISDWNKKTNSHEIAKRWTIKTVAKNAAAVDEKALAGEEKGRLWDMADHEQVKNENASKCQVLPDGSVRSMFLFVLYLRIIGDGKICPEERIHRGCVCLIRRCRTRKGRDLN